MMVIANATTFEQEAIMEREIDSNPPSELSPETVQLDLSIPKIIRVQEPSDMARPIIAVLTSGLAWTYEYPFEDIDGFLIYCVPDANPNDEILVTNGRKAGLAVTDRMDTDYIVTAGKGITIPFQDKWIALRNLSTNTHHVVVVAFRGRQPIYM